MIANIAFLAARISLAAFLTLIALGVVLGFCLARLYYAAKIEGGNNDQ